MSETQPDFREALEILHRLASSNPAAEYGAARQIEAAYRTLAPILAQVSALQAEVERLQRERDEAREVVALCNNSFGSYSYHTSPHPAEQIEKIKEQARSEWRRAEEALERLQKVEGERGVAVAALRPFAAMAAQYDGYGDAYQPLTCRPSVGMLRSARSAVTETKEGENV